MSHEALPTPVMSRPSKIEVRILANLQLLTPDEVDVLLIVVVGSIIAALLAFHLVFPNLNN